jgi:hypothetical protein
VQIAANVGAIPAPAVGAKQIAARNDALLREENEGSSGGTSSGTPRPRCGKIPLQNRKNLLGCADEVIVGERKNRIDYWEERPLFKKNEAATSKPKRSVTEKRLPRNKTARLKLSRWYKESARSVGISNTKPSEGRDEAFE